MKLVWGRYLISILVDRIEKNSKDVAYLKKYSYRELGYMVRKKYEEIKGFGIDSDRSLYFFVLNSFCYPKLFKNEENILILLNFSLLENEKIEIFQNLIAENRGER